MPVEVTGFSVQPLSKLRASPSGPTGGYVREVFMCFLGLKAPLAELSARAIARSEHCLAGLVRWPTDDPQVPTPRWAGGRSSSIGRSQPAGPFRRVGELPVSALGYEPLWTTINGSRVGARPLGFESAKGTVVEQVVDSTEPTFAWWFASSAYARGRHRDPEPFHEFESDAQIGHGQPGVAVTIDLFSFSHEESFQSVSGSAVNG